ncbi:uracil phosphoribosyltransferase [Picosynechococcus sp. PCC 7117]|uniref:uracil phosphoribosyltransferase n=1 Tax=Picosynechococcus sp. PCC 7117 TaxID=195498 RepID=UPI0008109148|nr:uracil phosphoribosyltransferase [Picosynechococcus sp. PCC 7117]ANV87538.1 uracil phosphoribosyltransferase [Picosynechococcus sp. PCC 7117]
MASQLRVFVPDHPLLKHWLAIARETNTPTPLFKTAMKELGKWLTYEACRYWLPTLDAAVETPLAQAPATLIHPQTPLIAIPILRAGLSLMEGAQEVIPNIAATYHLGYRRDEQTLEVACYLNNLPAQFAPETRLLLLDPMLATGGTITAAMAEVTKRGIAMENVRIISVVAAPPALQKLSLDYPALQIYTAMIDQELNDQGFIVPGLGDAGDRTFGTR